jgi:hypothetical protein
MLHYLLSEKVWEPYGSSVMPSYDDVRSRDIMLMHRDREYLVVRIADFLRMAIGNNS